MKNAWLIRFLFCCLLPAPTLWGQTERGAAPLRSGENIATGVTRALIAGISLYGDPDIPDLQFADRDARVFYEYLRSEAGGSVPDQNIRLLTNEKATQAAILDALFWLNHVSKKGDQVILYFSGHGDVEKQTLWQLGYLLTHDTPFNNYPNNAVELEYLNKIITTLSVGKEVRTVVIMDACRSGKLAGADNLGPSLTAEQLAKRSANEVRIMSCKPDQLSLEGTQWGGGRGLFSFYFVNGLKGMAESMPDSYVRLEEVQDFLKTSMRASIRDFGLATRQDAVFTGDEQFTLSKVDAATLAALQQETGAPIVASAAPSERGFDTPETNYFEGLSLDILISDSTFMQHAQARGADFFQYFVQWLSSASVRDTLTEAQRAQVGQFITLANHADTQEAAQRLVAVQLHNWAQEIINLFLKGDAAALSKRYYKKQTTLTEQYPHILEAARSLLPPEHPLQKPLLIKYHYFNGIAIRLRALRNNQPIDSGAAIQAQKKALELDPRIAYPYNEIGVVHLLTGRQAEAAACFDTAALLAPSWAIPVSNRAVVHVLAGQSQAAIQLAETAIRLQSNFDGAYITLGAALELQKNYLKAEDYYRKAIQINPKNYISFERLAYLLSLIHEYEDADEYFKRAALLKKEQLESPIRSIVYGPGLHIGVGQGFPDFRDIELIENPVTLKDFFHNAKIYYEYEQYENAEKNFLVVFRKQPDFPEVCAYLGKVNFRLFRHEVAELYFNLALQQTPEDPEIVLESAHNFRAQNRRRDEEERLRELLKLPTTKFTMIGWYDLLDLLHYQKRYLEQENWLWQYFGNYTEKATEMLTTFYEKMQEKMPDHSDWQYKQAVFRRYVLNDRATATAMFQNLLSKDSFNLAAAYIHDQLGDYYLKISKDIPKDRVGKTTSAVNLDLVGDEDRAHTLDQSILHFEQALRLAPEYTNTQYGWVEACMDDRRGAIVVPVLEQLYQKGQIDLTNRFRLIDVYNRSAQYERADTLLGEAEAFLPAPHARAWVLKSQNFEWQGKYEAAVPCWKKAMEEQAEHPEQLSYSLARTYAAMQARKEAMKWLSNALEKKFNYAMVIQYDPVWQPYREDGDFLALLKKFEISLGN